MVIAKLLIFWTLLSRRGLNINRICKICSDEIAESSKFTSGKNLFVHVRRKHKMSKIDYMITYEHKNFQFETCGWCEQDAVPRVRDVNGELQLYYKKFLCNSNNCKINRKKFNPRSYISAKNTYKLNEEQSKLKVQKASPFHREFFSSEEEYIDSQAKCSLRGFCDRYGKIIGRQKFEEYKKLRSYLTSEEYFVKKLGEEQGKAKYQLLQKQKAITKENLVRKYGEIEGTKRYINFLNKTLKTFVSEKSINFLNTISQMYTLNIRHGRNSSEKKIICENTVHPVDGYCEELNLVFEFFGDKWHVNPELYNENDTNIRKIPAREVWNKDFERLNNILQKVNAILICWENDWKNKPELVLNQIGYLLEKLKHGNLTKKLYYLGVENEYASN